MTNVGINKKIQHVGVGGSAMKIVKLSGGKWAIRKFSFLRLQYVYKDLWTHSNYWWTRSDKYFTDCLADSEESLRQLGCLQKVVRKVKV